MKKWILFLLCILAVQSYFKIVPPVLGQEDKDAQGIKKAVEGYLSGFLTNDIDSLMKNISTNYLDQSDGDIIDYIKFKSNTENRMNNFLKKYVDNSNSDLQFSTLDIQDNMATVEFEYNWKGFNLDTSKEDSVKHKRLVSLVKENGIWKIAQWKRLK